MAPASLAGSPVLNPKPKTNFWLPDLLQVNDLDLTVRASGLNGIPLLGNGGSVTDPTSPDRENNVEQVGGMVTQGPACPSLLPRTEPRTATAGRRR